MLCFIQTDGLFGGVHMPRNKYPEETIKLILDVATRLFMEKGYENTSLQDIIHETKLSKGAIYHHFSSKEDIFEAVCERVGDNNALLLAKVRDDKTLNGLDKLREIFRSALTSSTQRFVISAAPNLLLNSKFLASQIKEIFDCVAPDYIKPILEEGIADGSIMAENPEEVAEAILILSNIWLNPLVYAAEPEKMRRKCAAFNKLMNSMGMELLDEELIEEFINYCSVIHERRNRLP